MNEELKVYLEIYGCVTGYVVYEKLQHIYHKVEDKNMFIDM